MGISSVSLARLQILEVRFFILCIPSVDLYSLAHSAMYLLLTDIYGSG